MKVIGITGGVGSGKSQVLDYMKEQFGATICQADHVAWELQEPGKSCYLEIVECFGIEILKQDGTINRSALGAIVFEDEAKLQRLNDIMHPSVKKEIKRRLDAERSSGTELFLVEAALLIEEHYDEICDELWYIKTDTSVRRERLKASRDYNDEKIDAIMSAQLTDSVFEEACQRVIDNSGEFRYTCKQINEIMKQLGV